MEEKIETRVSPAKVWEAWEKAHELHGAKKIEPGLKNRSKSLGKKQFRYQILDVDPGKSFSILWKTLFVRLIFTHTVSATRKGSEIHYQVKIKGLFAWPVRWLLGNKIKNNISQVLKQIARQLENQQ